LTIALWQNKPAKNNSQPESSRPFISCYGSCERGFFFTACRRILNHFALSVLVMPPSSCAATSFPGPVCTTGTAGFLRQISNRYQRSPYSVAPAYSSLIVQVTKTIPVFSLQKNSLPIR
jgi:hypothetical protein